MAILSFLLCAFSARLVKYMLKSVKSVNDTLTVAYLGFLYLEANNYNCHPKQ